MTKSPKFYRISGKKDCEHKLVFLGSDKGNNEYYKCQKCGGVILKEAQEAEKHVQKIRRESEENEKGLVARLRKSLLGSSKISC